MFVCHPLGFAIVVIIVVIICFVCNHGNVLSRCQGEKDMCTLTQHTHSMCVRTGVCNKVNNNTGADSGAARSLYEMSDLNGDGLID